MQLRITLSRWLLCILALLGSAHLRAAVDTDGDGQTDTQELADGTDPLNAQSVAWRNLAAWRFGNGTIAGDAGQVPLVNLNVALVPAYDGNGVSFPNSSPVGLQFRAVEANGLANVSIKRGSIRFRFQPRWEASKFGGTGPGHWATLVQTTNLALTIDPAGNNVFLTSRTLRGDTVTNISASTSIDGEWVDVLMAYSPEGTKLFFGAGECDIVFTGTGIAELPDTAAINQFINFGSAPDGSGSVNGVLDEITTFNAPGVLATNFWGLSAIATSSPPSLNLVWNSATNLIVDMKKRVSGSTNWVRMPSLIGTNYLDRDVTAGGRYEYQLNSGYSFIQAEDARGEYITGAVAGTPIESPGKVILLVDQSLTNQIETDLRQFITNLVADGWQVLRADVPRHIDDSSTTNSFLTNYYNITNIIAPFIRTNYALYSNTIRQILIVGHATIPYSGTIADDGHNTSTVTSHGAHTGAWPADMYYGDIDGIWTDTKTSTNSFYDFNRNYPGDGRFDQDTIPKNAAGVAELEIPVARIDFYNLPAFSDSEAVLLSKYFKKNAEYRAGLRSFAAEAIARDYLLFPTYVVDRTASEMISKISVLKDRQIGDAFATPAGSFLFALHSGPGRFDAVNDQWLGLEHNTADIAHGLTATNCAFYYLLGSYFPDWNSYDNVLRATLATTNGGLASGAVIQMKSWRADGFAAGYPLGHDVRDVVSTWESIYGHSARTIEYMGDATLRYPMTPPPNSVTNSFINSTVFLSWTAGSTNDAGYYIYRSTNGISGPFDRISSDIVRGTSMPDSSAPGGSLLYMVRGVQVVTNGAGTYTNLTQGALYATTLDLSSCCIADQTADEDSSVAPITFSLGSAATQNGLLVLATSSDETIVPNENILISGTGDSRTLNITPAANQFGDVAITVFIQTEAQMILKPFLLTINPVNDAPSFYIGGNQDVPQDAGPQSVPNQATLISAGPVNEGSQVLSFELTPDLPALFSVQPAIDSSGTLTYTPALHARGVAVISVKLHDNGGTAFGGQDTSSVQTFSITIGSDTDTDGNGLPDDFEAAFTNGHASPDADSDGDGFSNLQEYLAGTDPLNSRSSLRITSVSSDGDSTQVQYNSAPGLNYALEFNDSFPSGVWTSPVTSASTGTLTRQSDGGASVSSRAYRVSTTRLGNTLSSEPAGFMKLTLIGNSDTLLSMPFVRPPAELGAVSSIDGSTVRVYGAPAWTANQWVYSPPQTNTYYLLFMSGAREGDLFTVIANGTNDLTLDLQGGTLEGVAPDDRVAIVPYWTLGTIFPAGQGVFPSSGFSQNTLVLLPNFSGSGINLSAQRSYYFNSGVWRQLGSPGIKNDDVLPPDMFYWVRHNVPTNSQVIVSGTVLRAKTRLPVRRGSSAQQDNLLALPRFVPVTLNASGLIESGVMRPSSGFNIVDMLLVFDNTSVAKNKSAARTYYYNGVNWRLFGSGGDRGSDIIFAPGTALVLRAGAGTSSLTWTNSVTY